MRNQRRHRRAVRKLLAAASSSQYPVTFRNEFTSLRHYHVRPSPPSTSNPIPRAQKTAANEQAAVFVVPEARKNSIITDPCHASLAESVHRLPSSIRIPKFGFTDRDSEDPPSPTKNEKRLSFPQQQQQHVSGGIPKPVHLRFEPDQITVTPEGKVIRMYNPLRKEGFNEQIRWRGIVFGSVLDRHLLDCPAAENTNAGLNFDFELPPITGGMK